MKYCVNCLQRLSVVLLAEDSCEIDVNLYECETPECVRRGLVTVFGYDRPEYPVTEGGEK